jgi:hypothetical protein
VHREIDEPAVGMTHVVAGGQVLDGASGGYFGFLGEFETCPDWAPTLDKRRQCARLALKTMSDHRFDHRANRLAKVRNVSRLGSQSSILELAAISLILLGTLKAIFAG